jgi:hypothetical protein
MEDAEFLKGEIDIEYLERAGSRVLAAPARGGLEQALAVAAAILADQAHDRPPPSSLTARPPQSSTWTQAARLDGLRDSLE